MRCFISILIFTLCSGTFLQAQVKTSFSSEIFKPAELPKPAAPVQVQLSDFRYESDAFSAQSTSLIERMRTQPGVAFLASAIVPGTGQAINKNWARAGIYFAIEAVGIIYHLERNATARRQEKAYESFANQNWSVVAYSQWLVEYSDANGLNQTQLNQLRDMVYSNGRPIAPTWGSTPNDWKEVNIRTLHEVELQTPFIFEDRYASEFSHALPEYGSQQYYELISKYYQFQSGWQDFYNVAINSNSPHYDPNHSFIYGWDGKDQPNALFYEGRDRAHEFNETYRTAGNILKLLLVNHVVSAFDALFTVQLKNSRIETNTNLMKLEPFSLTWHF